MDSPDRWDEHFQISTVFDQDPDSPHGILYSSSIRNTLMRLLPPGFLLFEGSQQAFIEEFSRLLPIVRDSEWGKESLQVSIYLLCRQRGNGVKFFYEMISRWLMPGRKPIISSFFAADFTLPKVSGDLYTICEIVISVETAADHELIRQQMPVIESEIRLGLVSVYHANRILEIKGLSADEKTSSVQERISSLLERRPKDFDHDIFAQMQHFLVMCSEEFKGAREYAHMSRIIYVFYLFGKALRKQMEKNPDQRFVHVKVAKTCLHLPLGFKKVLGVFAALNFQGDNELFDERHFASALKSRFPHVEIVDGSFFSRSSREERIQLLYVEVEKEDGTEFTLSETRGIHEGLPGAIRNGIEKLAHPLFMPRNEEEVIRNIITLSNQLKVSHDLPQVIITFEGQTETELAFTVIWLRVLKETDVPLQQIFDSGDSFLKFEADRIRRVGMLRRKYPREATVFKIRLLVQNFLRSDHSVDLFKARFAIVLELQRIFGEFRDFNGGMIAKQHEQFLGLKMLLPHLDGNEEMLLENFFHSIYPVELRSLFNPLYLKNLFTMFLDAVKKNSAQSGICQKSDDACCYFLLSFREPKVKEGIADCISGFQIPGSQLLTMYSQDADNSYLGVVYLEAGSERRAQFADKVVSRWQDLTFELQTGDTAPA